MSCEALKNEQNPEIIEEKARLIYEDYISILSPKEVKLSEDLRHLVFFFNLIYSFRSVWIVEYEK
jgi:regulator of G-protein signaling